MPIEIETQSPEFHAAFGLQRAQSATVCIYS